MKTPQILYEDNHLIAVCKPPGMPSQQDVSEDFSLVQWVEDYLRTNYQKPGNVYVALLHRIDRPVGGVIVFAKTSKAAGRMSNLIQNREFHKTYLAVTESIPYETSGTLEHHLIKLEGKNVMKAFKKPKNGSLYACLNYQVLQTHEQRALIEVHPITGRQHQIRVQLAAISCPIVGDAKYARNSNFLPDQSIALWSWKLSFVHPVSK
ncbi:MAG: RNA pseudouridine synthase, partial [Bacteroidia bacterium]|nr:RNA pseudouridine synthase [Bacteroidia bacterium]